MDHDDGIHFARTCKFHVSRKNLLHHANHYLLFPSIYELFPTHILAFSTTLSCEILDLTERRRYQRNELLKRQKTEKCKQEFIITEKGYFHPVSFETKVKMKITTGSYERFF